MTYDDWKCSPPEGDDSPWDVCDQCGKPSLTVQLYDAEKDALQKIADARGVTMTAVVLEALRLYAEKHAALTGKDVTDTEEPG